MPLYELSRARNRPATESKSEAFSKGPVADQMDQSLTTVSRTASASTVTRAVTADRLARSKRTYEPGSRGSALVALSSGP